jgi:CBS domain containing-hemolysin-like protein
MSDPSLAQEIRSGAWIALVAYCLLVAGSAVLSAFQVAVMSVRRSRVAQLAEGGSAAARRAEPLLERPEPFMIASRLALAAASALCTVLAAMLALALASLSAGANAPLPAERTTARVVAAALPVSAAAAIGGNLLFFFLGDVLPRIFAAGREERVLLAWAWPMQWFTLAMAPFVWLVGRLGRSVAAIVGSPLTPPGRSAPSEAEIKVLLEGSAEEGILEPEEKEMIHSIIRFTDTTVRQIMVPRIDMTVVELTCPLPQVVDLMLEAGHSRVPVYEGTVDHIVGIVHVKDLLRPLVEGRHDIPLKDLLRAPYYVPEGKKVDELLHEFRREQIQLAIVVDEYGGTSGLVTIEDILEEIVGDIADEYDVEEPLVQPLDDNEYLLDARLSIDDANEQLQLGLPGEEYETIAGFVFGQLGRLPEVGEVVHYGRLDFIVDQTDGRRISKIRLVRTDRPEQESPAAAA